jgi:hypothetical protein
MVAIQYVSATERFLFSPHSGKEAIWSYSNVSFLI